jgi:hypothetical protein
MTPNGYIPHPITWIEPEPEAEKMADEIHGQNVIRVVGGLCSWTAFIGPDPESGIAVSADTPMGALTRLVGRLNGGYAFDPSWYPRETDEDAAIRRPPERAVPADLLPFRRRWPRFLTRRRRR